MWANEIMEVIESIANVTAKTDYELYTRWKEGRLLPDNGKVPPYVKDIKEITKTMPAIRALLVKPMHDLKLYIDN